MKLEVVIASLFVVVIVVIIAVVVIIVVVVVVVVVGGGGGGYCGGFHRFSPLSPGLKVHILAIFSIFTLPPISTVRVPSRIPLQLAYGIVIT